MDNKIILDLVHGYISLSEDVLKVIDTASFQRLRNIRQLTANHLFPSTNHTRFEHSLGVMHLANKYYDAIEENLKKKILNDREDTDDKNEIDKDVDFQRKHLTYAALLHDVGHAPFSHLGESFFDKDEIITNLEKEIIDINDRLLKDRKEEDKIHIELLSHEKFIKASPHELMSCYVIIKKYAELLLNIYEHFNLEFIFRIITGTKYKGEKPPYFNMVIEIINSSSIDVDKMDYLLRDNYMTGAVATKIDVERIFHCLHIGDDYELNYKSNGLIAVQKIIDCRDSLYLTVYNHHTVIYSDFLIEILIEHLKKIHSTENTNDQIGLAGNDYFSCNAIANNLVSDVDILKKLADVRNLTENNKGTNFTNKIIPQMFNRNYLKPLWKTISEFNTFLSSIPNQKKKNDFMKKIDNKETRKKVVKLLINKINNKDISHGDIFIISRNNNFYSMKESVTFYIYSEKDGSKDEIEDLLPQKEFKNLFEEISFYVVCKKEIINDVKKYLIEIISTGNYSL